MVTQHNYSENRIRNGLNVHKEDDYCHDLRHAEIGIWIEVDKIQKSLRNIDKHLDRIKKAHEQITSNKSLKK